MRRLWGKRKASRPDSAPPSPDVTRDPEKAVDAQGTDDPLPSPRTIAASSAAAPQHRDRAARQVAFVEDKSQQAHLGVAGPNNGSASVPRSASTPAPMRTNAADPVVAIAKRPRVSEPIATTSVGPSGTIRATPATSHHPFPSFQSPAVAASLGHRTALSEGHSPVMRSISPFSTTSSVAPSTWRMAMSRPDSRADSFGQIQAPLTWSEMCESDLVSNLGGRERTRQEVLWEIVGSEERYVKELISLKECYVDPLLHPLRSPPNTSPPTPTSSHAHHHSADDSMASNVSLDHLPIAARFASTLNRTPSVASSRDGENVMPHIHGQSRDSLYRTNGSSHQHHTAEPSADSSTPLIGAPVRQPGRPLRPRNSNVLPASPSSASLPATFRHHLKSLGPVPAKKLHKPKSAAPAASLSPPTLPPHLRTILEVIGEGLLQNHELLSLRLRERYAEQYPLVRTLSDVWAEQRWIVEHYATYVLHLEQALDEVETALSHALALRSKVKATADDKKLAKFIMRLEERATARGESGLAICLSKPFQRLLKYPLLFQNLLYHTDPATSDYAAAQAMALEIDRIVRSIEDEKISEEEREKTRDVWARIEGINDKALMLPKSDRLLVEEAATYEQPLLASRRAVSDVSRKVSPDPAGGTPRVVKNQKSTRRLSDYLSSSTSKEQKTPSMGSKKDIWLVHFSDVVLRCQRTGLTAVPRASTTKPKRPSAVVGQQGKQRNLYQFLKVERWEMRPPATTTGVVAMDAIHRRRNTELGETDLSETEEEDEPASPPEDTESRMSFNYLGDEATPTAALLPKVMAAVTKPPPARRVVSTAVSSASPSTQAVVGRGGPANAKFSARLRPSYSTVPAFESRTISPTPSAGARRFDAPTAASKARATSRPVSPMPHSTSAQGPGAMTARHRAVSSPSPEPSPPRRRSASNAGGGGMTHSRSNGSDLDSGLARYQTFWEATT